MTYVPPPVPPNSVRHDTPEAIEQSIRNSLPPDVPEGLIEAFISLAADGSVTIWTLPDGRGWIRAEVDPSTIS